MSLEKITVDSVDYQIQFWGADDDKTPEWDKQGRFGRCSTAFLVGVANDYSPFEIRLHIGERPSDNAEIYGSSTLLVDETGIQVANVTESTLEGELGILGQRYSLPWQGDTKIELISSTEKETDREGTSFPKSLDVFLSSAETPKG